MAQPVALPEEARFSCRSCGVCCRGWAVPVDQETVDRLRKHNWGGDPFEPTRTTGGPYRIRLVEGRCFFLDPENRCRIHSELSYEAKPPVCRSFPLSVLEVGGRRYARLSFWCPTVAENAGKPLEHQARWVKDTARHADKRTSPVRLNEAAELTPGEFERIHGAIIRFVRDRSLPLGDRLAAASALIYRLDRAARKPPVSVAPVLESAEAEGAAALAREMRGRGHGSGGRRVLSLYLLQDREEGRAAMIARLFSVLLFGAGATRLRSRAVPARASWRQVQRVAFAPTVEGDELLTRYFASKLDSRRYVAGEATLVIGFNLLVAAYGMIDVLSRMRAATGNRASCSDEDIRLAVRAADLLVVEHPGLYQGEFYRHLTTAALGSADLCADVLARVAGGHSRRSQSV